MAMIDAIRWESLWREIAGHDIPIPGANSFVYYYPQIHAANSDQPNLANDMLIQGENWQLLCRVVHVEFLASPPPDSRIFVRFRLRRAAGDEQPQVGPNHLVQPNPLQFLEEHDFQWKRITQGEGSETSSQMTVPIAMAEAMPVHFIPGGYLNFRFMREAEPVHDIQYQEDPAGRRRRLGRGWPNFRRANGLRPNDELVFANMGGQLRVGVRRFDAPPAVPSGQVEAARNAYFAHGFNLFVVDYYPHAGINPYVILFQ